MSDLVMVFVAIFGLLGIGAVGVEFTKRWFSLREKQVELMADKTAEKAAQYAAHVERLEQRMRVLERIATDKGVDIAMQIETLRDDPVLAQIADEELNQ